MNILYNFLGIELQSVLAYNSSFIIFMLISIVVILAIMGTIFFVKQRKKKTIMNLYLQHRNNGETQQTILILQNQINNISSSFQNLPRSSEVDLITEKIKNLQGDLENWMKILK